MSYWLSRPVKYIAFSGNEMQVLVISQNRHLLVMQSMRVRVWTACSDVDWATRELRASCARGGAGGGAPHIGMDACSIENTSALGSSVVQFIFIRTFTTPFFQYTIYKHANEKKKSIIWIIKTPKLLPKIID